MKIKYGENENCSHTIQENPQEHIGVWCLQSRKQTTVHKLLEGILDQMGQVACSAARAGDGVEGNKPGGGSCLRWWSHTQRTPAAILTITRKGTGHRQGMKLHTPHFPGCSTQRPERIPEKSHDKSALDPGPQSKFSRPSSLFPRHSFPSLAVHPNAPGQLAVVQVPGSPYRPQEVELLHF